jgi:hypothetical protein
MILQATMIPKPRKPSKPGRAARERRLHLKRHRSEVKKTRRGVTEE